MLGYSDRIYQALQNGYGDEWQKRQRVLTVEISTTTITTTDIIIIIIIIIVHCPGSSSVSSFGC